MRITEVSWPTPPTLQDLIDADSDAKYEVPIDTMTDCRDLFELETGVKGVPQDRSQRLIVMSLREKRLINKLRHTIWCDTTDMLANSLTKHSTCDPLFYRYLKSGYINMQKQMLAAPRHRPVHSYTESDLEQMDN